MVDAYVSGAYAARCAGSSPVLGTRRSFKVLKPSRKFLSKMERSNCGDYTSRVSDEVVASKLRRRAGGEIGIHATLRG